MIVRSKCDDLHREGEGDSSPSRQCCGGDGGDDGGAGAGGRVGSDAGGCDSVRKWMMMHWIQLLLPIHYYDAVLPQMKMMMMM